MNLKITVILAFTIMSFNCSAQPGHVAADEAKHLYDRAQEGYAKYSTNRDSIMAVLGLLDKAIAIDSNYYEAWTAKLGFQCQLHWFDLAIGTAGDITRLFPQETSVMFFRGILQFKMKHDVEAIATFRRLLETYDTIAAPPAGSEALKTDLINKALTIKLLGGVFDANKMLEELAANEQDPAQKNYILSYIKATPEKIVSDMAP